MRDQVREEPEGRRWRPLGLLNTRYGSVALLIAIVLLTQAGLVYVAVDQISTSDDPTVIQPANGSRPAAPPISVNASDPAKPSAPTAERRVQTLDPDDPTEEPPAGRDVAAERRPGSTPAGPPDEAPAAEPAQPGPADAPEERPAPPEQPPAPPEQPATQDDQPAARDTASENQDPHDHQEADSETPAEDQDSQHGRHGHGTGDHEPPGQGGDNPGNGNGGGSGGGNGNGGGRG